MKAFLKAVVPSIVASVLAAGPNPSGNAALRYWSAFSQLQDSALTVARANEITTVLNGTADYDAHKYEGLIEKNRLALEIMSRGTLLPQCDWGLDYDLGADLPVEYAREGLALGRLNVLYALQQMKKGDIDGAVHALVAGLRFSHDLASGGSLFANVVAKSLIVAHLRVIVEAAEHHQLNTALRLRLKEAVGGARLDLNWPLAAKRDLELLRRQYAQGPESTAALDEIEATYVAAIDSKSADISAELALKRAPKGLAELVPKLGGVLKAKQDLSDAVRRAQTVLR